MPWAGNAAFTFTAGPLVRIRYTTLPNCRGWKSFHLPREEGREPDRVSNTNLYHRPKERYLTASSNSKYAEDAKTWLIMYYRYIHVCFPQ